MRAAKKLFNFYINSSIHVALAVVSLAVITLLHHRLPLDWSLLLFIFFGTVTAYNFVKYAGVAGLYHRSLTKGLKNIRILSVVSFLGMAILLFFIPFRAVLWTGVFGILTIFYGLPILAKHKNLRSISGLKIFIIALVWAGMTVIVPLVAVNHVFSEELVIEFLQRFLFVLVWILPFEIRDLKYDLEQLGTLPQRVGVTPTKVLGMIMLVGVVGLELYKTTSNRVSFIALTVTAIVSAIMVWSTKENQTRYFAAFWVEGLPILWLLLLLLLRSM